MWWLGRGNGRMGGDRDRQYPPRRDGYAADPGYRAGPPSQPSERYPPPREEYASDQVKDLLELYFRDPQAFDQYAKTYYYGERMERARARYGRVSFCPLLWLLCWWNQSLYWFSCVLIVLVHFVNRIYQACGVDNWSQALDWLSEVANLCPD